MGCTGNEGIKTIEDNHNLDIPNTHKLDKKEKINLSENTDKYVMNSSNYYKDQIPDKKSKDINNKFVDKLFPTKIISTETEHLIQIDKSKIEWRSAKDIFGKNVAIFGESTSIKDIKLGPADNSYFVSAMSSLSEFPNLILRLFRTVQLPKDGGPIEICIKIEGKWTIVYLDDKFMVNKVNGLPVFSTSPTKNIWGLLLEKAWAKVCGGYENIINGTCSEIFDAFTPFRTMEINIKKMENNKLWEYINTSFNHNCMITATTKEEFIDYESIGLFSGYSFSLFEYKNKDDENNEKDKNDKTDKNDSTNIIRKLKIRNPIGDNNYFEHKTNGENMENLGIDGFQDNGIFLMQFTNFMKFFSSLTICIPTSIIFSHLIEIPIEKANDFGTISVLIEEESNIFISILSLNNRFHEKIIPDLDIFKNLILIRIFRNKKKANYIASSSNEPLSATIKPGEYICIYNVDYKTPGAKRAFPFSINISNTSNFKYCLDEPDNDLQLLKYIMIPAIESIPKYEKYLKQDFVLFTGNRFQLTSFGFYYMKNRKRQTKYVKPSVYLKNFKSIEGEFPLCLKMNKNDVFFFLFNRIKIKSSYQTGGNAGFFKKEVSDAIQPLSYEKFPDQYCKEIKYIDKKYDFEFSTSTDNK